MAPSKGIYAKLDAGFLFNRKVIKAGPFGALAFVHTLCQNAQRGATGVVPAGDLEPWYVSRATGLSLDDARTGVTNARDADLIAIDGDEVTIVGWGEEWGRNAKSDAERARNYRQRKKESPSGETEPGDRHAPSRDGVTRNHASRDQRDQRDQRERQRDDSLSEGSDSGAPQDSDSEPAKRLRRDLVRSDEHVAQSLPGDWEPSSEATELAGFLKLDLGFEASQFVDWAKSGAVTSADWNAAFKRWLRQSRDVGRKSSKSKQKPAADVSKQRTADGTKYVLTELDGNVREISEAEAAALTAGGGEAAHSSGRSAGKPRGGKS